MSGSDGFEDARVADLLLGNSEQLKAGLAEIDIYLRERICARVRARFPSLQSMDLADVWEKTLTGVWRKVQSGTFHTDRPVDGLVWTIAYRRARDRLRKNQRDKRCSDEMVRALGEALHGTRAGSYWRELTAPERHEMLEDIRQATSSLSAYQEIVLQCFISGFPETECYEKLQDAVSNYLGERKTKRSVARALEEVRKKVVPLLRLKGYTG